jgi:preprotein translocase subunit SecB
MQIKEQNKLSFNGVDFVHVDFDAQKPFDKSKKVDIDVDTKVYFPKGDETIFNLLFETTLECEDFFKLQVTAIAMFKTSEVIDKELKDNFINTNAPAIVFPYIRAFISNFTANLGTTVGTLTLPPHIVSGPVDVIEAP